MSVYEAAYPQTVCQSRGGAQYRTFDNKNEYNFHIIAPAPAVPISFREWIEPQEGEAWRGSVSRRSTTGRITAVRRMNGGELVSRAPEEVVTHPVAAPFRSLKASRSFLKTRPERRTVPGTGLAHPLLGRRARALIFCSKSICRAQSINSVARPGGWLSGEKERERKEDS